MLLLSTGAIFFAALFTGALIQSASGFGMAIFSMSILPFFVPVKIAVVGMLPASIVMFIMILSRRRGFIDTKLLLFLVPSIFAGRGAGTWVLTILPDRQMRLVIGVLLISISIYYLLVRRRLELPKNRIAGSLAGLASGLMGGLANMGGPPLVLYLFTACEDKREYQGTITAAFLFAGITAILLHGAFGNITGDTLVLGLFGIPGSLLGTYFGLKIFNRTGKGFISWMLIGFTALSGTSLLLF